MSAPVGAAEGAGVDEATPHSSAAAAAAASEGIASEGPGELSRERARHERTVQNSKVVGP